MQEETQHTTQSVRTEQAQSEQPEQSAQSEQSTNASKPVEILLLTNRDSDNLGDQVIEACDISLITAAMRNLGYQDSEFHINTRAASIVSRKYLATRDEAILNKARKYISQADVVVFGGAPLFNYSYQVFYERTAITLELAQECNTPVIFSAIGVEGYDENDSRCQRLKKTLNFDVVKQITTRDDFDSLAKFIEDDSCLIDKVADPAVFADVVFRPFVAQEKTNKVGLFIIRSNAFTDSGIKFNRTQAAQFWCDLAKKLEAQGTDYEFITSGHFGDEAFIDNLIRQNSLKPSKCVFDMYTPERLIEKISSYQAIVSCRLHPSIIAYSLQVPAISLIWNAKVPQFYESIEYPERAYQAENLTADTIVKALKDIEGKPATKDPQFLYSVYASLLDGLRQALKPTEQIKPYTLEELNSKLPCYQGTSDEQRTKKIVAKMRRTYGKYNDLFDKNAMYVREIRRVTLPVVKKVKGAAKRIFKFGKSSS